VNWRTANRRRTRDQRLRAALPQFLRGDLHGLSLRDWPLPPGRPMHAFHWTRGLANLVREEGEREGWY
jgi:hypothetical protein